MVAVALVLAACSSGGSKKKASAGSTTSSTAATPVTVQVFSPEPKSVQGVCGTGVVIDLAVRSKNPDFLKAGIRAAQQGQQGRNPLYQNMVVTMSTTEPSLGGPQANLAGLFQIVSVSQLPDGSGEVWATWVNSVARWGIDIDSALDAYVVADAAPATVPADRAGLNVVSNVVHVPFHIAGAVGNTPCSQTTTTTVSSSSTSSTGHATTTAPRATTTTRATVPPTTRATVSPTSPSETTTP